MGAPSPFNLPDLFLALLPHIGRRRDLLSLALTSKVHYGIIVPSFLDLIHIRCDPRRIHIWQWLASAPHLAARVRTLELYKEDGIGLYRPIIPSPYRGYSIEDPETEEAFVQSLTEALKLMTQLHRLRLSPDAILSRANCGRLFISLGQHFDMEESYFGMGHFNNEPANFQVLSPLLNFDNITTFSLDIFFESYWTSKYGRTDPTWIMQMKNLKNLRLMSVDSDYIVLSAICRRAYWPRLVEFSLHGQMDLSPSSVQGIFNYKEYDAKSKFQFGNFIRRHPTLERFEIRQEAGNSDFSAFSIEPEIMSQLRSFIWSSNYFQWSNRSPLDDWFPADVSQPLEYLECSVSAKSLPALRTMTFLRALHIVSMDLNMFEHLVEAVPDIQQLYIPCRKWFPTHRNTLEVRQLQDRVVTSLLKLKHLVQLEGLVEPNHGYVYSEHIIKGLKEHERLLYIDCFTWEQLELIVKAAVEDKNKKCDIDCLTETSSLVQQLTVTIPNIRKSAGFYINCFSAPLTV